MCDEEELMCVSLDDDDFKAESLTIGDFLRQTQEEDSEMTIKRDEYMLQMQEAMQAFKRLYTESQDWDCVTDPTAHIKQYFCRDSQGQRYMKIRGYIECDDPKKIVIMERDYCYRERRHRWDTLLTNIVQVQEYDCRQRGTIRLVSCEVALPCCLFSPRHYLGLEWDRYCDDRKSATLLFKTLTPNEYPPMFTAHDPHVGGECFVGIHVLKDPHSHNHCYINYILKLPSTLGRISGLLFDRYYMRKLLARIRLYERIIQQWKEYYPNNGRVIR